MTSDEGLNAYGAVDLGTVLHLPGLQRPRRLDAHLERRRQRRRVRSRPSCSKGDGSSTGTAARSGPSPRSAIAVPYRTDGGHGREGVHRLPHASRPIVREADGKWVSDPPDAGAGEGAEAVVLAHEGDATYKAFRKTMELHANSSNNTIFADADGNIAYFHAQLHPEARHALRLDQAGRRQRPGTEWNGLHARRGQPALLNPPNGWLYNTNNWPWSAAGPTARSSADFPRYMDTAGENPRGLHAHARARGAQGLHARLAASPRRSTATCRPSRELMPAAARRRTTPRPDDPLKAKLAEPIALLRGWDFRWAAASCRRRSRCSGARSLGQVPRTPEAGRRACTMLHGTCAHRTRSACERCCAGARRTGCSATSAAGRRRGATSTASSASPATSCSRSTTRGRASPVPFTSARWGSLASFGARTYPGTKRMYGTSGNSFVAVVEFGQRVRARAVTAGGESGDPGRPLRGPGRALRRGRPGRRHVLRPEVQQAGQVPLPVLSPRQGHVGGCRGPQGGHVISAHPGRVQRDGHQGIECGHEHGLNLWADALGAADSHHVFVGAADMRAMVNRFIPGDVVVKVGDSVTFDMARNLFPVRTRSRSGRPRRTRSRPPVTRRTTRGAP